MLAARCYALVNKRQIGYVNASKLVADGHRGRTLQSG